MGNRVQHGMNTSNLLCITSAQCKIVQTHGKHRSPSHSPPSRMWWPDTWMLTGDTANTSWGPRMWIIELSNEVWSIDITFILLWILLITVPFPFDEELQLPLHVTVQYSFNLEMFFANKQDRLGWWQSVMTRNRVLQCQSELDNWENRM